MLKTILNEIDYKPFPQMQTITCTLEELEAIFGGCFYFDWDDYPDDNIKTSICIGLVNPETNNKLSIWDYKGWNYQNREIDELEIMTFSIGYDNEEDYKEFLKRFEILKPIPLEKQVEIYNNFLINFHTATWTGNDDNVRKCFDKIQAYSYARTNSYEGETNLKRNISDKQTLLNLIK